MKKQNHRYSPRPGSKVAAAIDAVRDSPMTPRELAKVLQRDSSAINTLLLRALTHAAIIKVKDHRGRLYFATPETLLDQQFTVIGKEEADAPESHIQTKQNIIRLQIAATEKSGTLISSNVHPITQIENDEPYTPGEHDARIEPLQTTDNSTSPPVVAGLFSDGELTIAIGGECLQLDTAQRQQLYSYLHKIRYLE